MQNDSPHQPQILLVGPITSVTVRLVQSLGMVMEGHGRGTSKHADLGPHTLGQTDVR